MEDYFYWSQCSQISKYVHFSSALVHCFWAGGLTPGRNGMVREKGVDVPCPMSHVKKWSLSACTEIWHFPLCLIKKCIAFYLLKLWGYGTHMSDSLWEQVWSFWALSPGHRLVRKCLHPLSHPAIPVCSWGLVSLGSPWSPGSPLWALRDRDDRYVLPGLKKKNKKQIMWQKGHDSHSL